MIQFVFCHGFGFNLHFWDNLAPYFAQEKCSFIDLGYFKKPTPPFAFDGQKIVGIGHSLGLLKLIKLYDNFDCLIGLNGFANFLGQNQVMHRKRGLELKALKQTFIKNPNKTLKQFYARCGIPEFEANCTLSELDLNLMLSDLELLRQPSSLSFAPTLILTSNDDSVVPLELINDNFLNQPNIELEILRDAQHGLGFKKSAEVYKRIMSFLNDTFTK